MKRLVILILVALSGKVSIAQISSIKFESQKEKSTVLIYDSLEDISVDNYKSLVGQTLFLKPSKKDKEKGYYQFLELLTAASTDFKAPRYKPSSRYSQYIDYNSVNSKYFEVLEAYVINGVDNRYSFIKLREKESSDILFYRFTTHPNYDFTVVGHFEKMKMIYKDKKVINKNNYTKTGTNIKFYSLKNGQEVCDSGTLPYGTSFTCKDVTYLDDKYFQLILVLHHNKFGDIYTDLNSNVIKYIIPISKSVHKTSTSKNANKTSLSNTNNGSIKSNTSYANSQSSGEKSYTINARCLGAIDEVTLDKITSFANKRDEGSLKVVVASGYAIIVPQGTKVTLVKTRTGKVRVKLPDGRMVWVLYKHIK